MPKISPELRGLLSLSPSKTTAFLLELAKAQADRRRPADLLTQLQRDGFVQGGLLDQRLIHVLDGLALDAARAFEAVQLSPVAPLGVCSVLAPSSQNRTLTTSRASEVVSDPTNVLALMCAQRFRASEREVVRLCTTHQVLRAQPLPKGAGFSRHFRMFALASAGKALAEDEFEVDAIALHMQVIDAIFDATRTLGCDFPNRRATLFVGPDSRTLATRVGDRLARVLPHVALKEQPLSSTYYRGLRVLFGADDVQGTHIPIADTGLFDWMAKLTNHARARFVASGLGIQLAPLRFRRAP